MKMLLTSCPAILGYSEARVSPTCVLISHACRGGELDHVCVGGAGHSSLRFTVVWC